MLFCNSVVSFEELPLSPLAQYLKTNFEISRKGSIHMTALRKAVFPVAGFGTRFLPATKAMLKELLPIVDKPLIQYAAEEAIAAGIDTLIFVTGRNKRAIEDHFDANNELEAMLRAKGKDAQADMVRNIIPEGVMRICALGRTAGVRSCSIVRGACCWW